MHINTHTKANCMLDTKKITCALSSSIYSFPAISQSVSFLPSWPLHLPLKGHLLPSAAGKKGNILLFPAGFLLLAAFHCPAQHANHSPTHSEGGSFFQRSCMGLHWDVPRTHGWGTLHDRHLEGSVYIVIDCILWFLKEEQLLFSRYICRDVLHHVL